MMKNLNAASSMCVRGVVPVDHPRPPSCGHAVLRSRLRFGLSMSAIIVLTDAVLRFSWVLRFYHSMFPSADSFALCTQFLEIFRRSIWNLLRVEWENLKHIKKVVAPPATLELQLQPEPISILHARTISSNRSSRSEDEMIGLLTHREAATNAKFLSVK